MVLEKTFEKSLGLQGDPVHPKGDQSWVFFGRTDGKAETPTYFAHLMQRVDLLEKTDAGRDWGQEQKGRKEDVMAG